MCGIAGIINFDGRRVEVHELQAMCSFMKHRGPDDEGFYCSGNIGLGMRRLSIIDVGGGHQPIANEDQSVWVVMNGEIYNFIELRKKLKEQGHLFKTESDTEVIVHLYEECGTDALHEMNGMFAFALYDERRRALWLARDRLGIKPLYYAHSGARLVFGSDLNALRGVLNLEIAPESFLRYLGLAYVPTPHVIYRGVEKIPPAHFLWVEDGRLALRKYWELSRFQAWQGGSDDAAAELSELFDDAVRLQLRSDVPVGIFLSGGVDSSSIVAMAAHYAGGPLRTFSVDFVGKQSADGAFARSVATRYRTSHRQVDMKGNEIIDILERFVGLLDEPVSDSAVVPTFILSEMARENGVKVLLTGAGGDELFGGYVHHYAPSVGSPRWIAESLPFPLRKIISSLWSCFQPERGLRASDPLLAWGCRISGVNLATCRRLLRDKTHFDKIIAAVREEFSALPTEHARLGYSYARMHIDLRTYLVDNILSLTDKATMAASIEGRVPLLDHRLAEFAFALPSRLNMLDGKPKGILKRVMQDRLPEDLLSRRKEGFNAPMRVWMEDGIARKLCDELTGTQSPLLLEMLDLEALKCILADPVARRQSAETLFALYLFSRWYSRRSEVSCATRPAS